MAFCGKCGTKFEDGAKFCPACGAPVSVAPQQPTTPAYTPPVVPGAPAQADIKDAQDNKAMAVLAYIIFLIPLLAAKDSPFARYHTNQGLVLAIAAVAYGIVYSILSTIVLAISWRLYLVVSILGWVSVVFAVLSVIGIINAVNGRMKPLPIIGGIRILK